MLSYFRPELYYQKYLYIRRKKGKNSKLSPSLILTNSLAESKNLCWLIQDIQIEVYI